MTKKRQKSYNEAGAKKPAKLTVDDFKKVMTEAERAAFAAGCRIEHGTALPEDYVVVARYERMLTENAKERDER